MILRIVEKLGPRGTVLALGAVMAAIATGLTVLSLAWNPVK
jgi:hypothetical protein